LCVCVCVCVCVLRAYLGGLSRFMQVYFIGLYSYNMKYNMNPAYSRAQEMN